MLPLYPRSSDERVILLIGGGIFGALLLSGSLANRTLGSEQYHWLYDISRRVAELVLWLFPNSLFPILDSVLGSTPIAYLLLGVITYCTSVWLGRYLSSHRSRTSAIKAATFYLLLSVVTYLISAYLFLKFYYMQPSPFKLFG